MAVKLLMIYNIRPTRKDEYYRYVLGEYLPVLQSLGLTMVEGWHTAYGDYPMRLIAFGVENEQRLREAMASDEWRTAKETLLKFVRIDSS